MAIILRYILAYFQDFNVGQIRIMTGDLLRRNLYLERHVASRVTEIRKILDVNQNANILTRVWRRLTGTTPTSCSLRTLGSYIAGMNPPSLMRHGGGGTPGPTPGGSLFDQVDALQVAAHPRPPHLRGDADSMLEERIRVGLARPAWHR